MLAYEKSDRAIHMQSLCGAALILFPGIIRGIGTGLTKIKEDLEPYFTSMVAGGQYPLFHTEKERKMDDDITVSVIMPVYNPEGDELRRAVASVLDQSFRDFELVICDDHSKEYVKEVIDEFSDQRIVYIRNEKNSGCAYSLNRCIEAARGELLIRQDSDDYSLPGRFEKIISEYKKEGRDIISSNIILFDEKGEWGHRDYPKTPLKKDFLFAVPFMHGACALKKTSVVNAGMYPVSDKTARCEEYALFMTMYSLGARGINIEDRLYAFNENHAAVKRRKYSDKIKEVKVKAEGFKKLKLYPAGFIYLAKPLIVGLIPSGALAKLKDLVFGRRK